MDNLYKDGSLSAQWEKTVLITELVQKYLLINTQIIKLKMLPATNTGSIL